MCMAPPRSTDFRIEFHVNTMVSPEHQHGSGMVYVRLLTADGEMMIDQPVGMVSDYNPFMTLEENADMLARAAFNNFIIHNLAAKG